MYKEYQIGAVIVAAGSGLRFGEKKQFKKLKSKPLYLYSLQRFIDCDLIDEIVLVVPIDLLKAISNEVTKLSPQVKVVGGGKLRQDSVFAGVNALSKQCEIICVHDAARPFVSVDLVERTIIACEKNDGAVAAMPAQDTVKEVNSNNNRIKKTIPRSKIWLAQTPQTFHRNQLIKALSYAKENKIQITDEATLLESMNYSIVVVEGNADNCKITTPNDWKLAELMLERDND